LSRETFEDKDAGIVIIFRDEDLDGIAQVWHLTFMASQNEGQETSTRISTRPTVVYKYSIQTILFF
jgi:hypothetical protein